LPFNEKEQIRFRDFVKELTENGVKIMISNSNTEFIRDIYKDFSINTIEIRYSIINKKKPTKELLIMNY